MSHPMLVLSLHKDESTMMGVYKFSCHVLCNSAFLFGSGDHFLYIRVCCCKAVFALWL